MTTVTEPPLIVPAVDVADMPALDQPDERACEFLDRRNRACRKRAAWALSVRVLCDCTRRDAALLLSCGRCYRDVLGGLQAAQCLTCGRLLPLLRAEPL